MKDEVIITVPNNLTVSMNTRLVDPFGIPYGMPFPTKQEIDEKV